MSLAEFAGPDQTDVAGHAALIASALQNRGPSTLALVFGAGLGLHPIRDGSLSPVVLVSSEGTETVPGAYPLIELSLAYRIVIEALGFDAPGFLESVGAFVWPDPEPYLSTGDDISSPAVGTVGCSTSWAGGSGFLTAGHVAPSHGTNVFQSGTLLGTVQFASNPAGGATAVQADVSIVELATGIHLSSPLAGTTAAAPNVTVDIHNGRKSTGDIMGFCSYVYWPRVNGTYGDTYFTTNDVSRGGDSGSAVSLNREVVGTVVGGTPNYTTYVQDIRYQLSQANPRGGGLAGLTV